MSAHQWAGVMEGDEAYAGAASYYRLVEAGKDIFGYEYIQPCLLYTSRIFWKNMIALKK